MRLRFNFQVRSLQQNERLKNILWEIGSQPIYLTIKKYRKLGGGTAVFCETRKYGIKYLSTEFFNSASSQQFGPNFLLKKNNFGIFFFENILNSLNIRTPFAKFTIKYYHILVLNLFSCVLLP